MKYLIINILVCVSTFSYSQIVNGEKSKDSLAAIAAIEQSDKEIIRWLNEFEDRNAVEKILQGTFENKVVLECNNGNLIIKELSYNVFGPPFRFKTIIKIADITRIEALKSGSKNFTGYDVNICSKPESIQLLQLNDKTGVYSKASIADELYEEHGSCDSGIRVQFPSDIAEKEIQRVYKALSDLCKNHGAEPKIGSLY